MPIKAFLRTHQMYRKKIRYLTVELLVLPKVIIKELGTFLCTSVARTANRTRNRRQEFFHSNSQYLVTSQQNLERTLQPME